MGCSQAWLHTQGLCCSTALRVSQQSAEGPGWAFLLRSFPSQSCYCPATCSHMEKETREELQERRKQPTVLAEPLRDLAAGGQEGLCPPRDSTGGSSLAPGCPSLGAVRRFNLSPLPYISPTKQVLILLNKYKVMAAGIGAKWPGDILESQMRSAARQSSLQELGIQQSLPGREGAGLVGRAWVCWHGADAAPCCRVLAAPPCLQSNF